MTDEEFLAKHNIERQRVFNEYALIQQLTQDDEIADFDAFEQQVNQFLDDEAAVATFLDEFAPLFADEESKQKFLLDHYGFAGF